jgi:type II secretion system protein N
MNLNFNLNLSPRLQQVLRWFGYGVFYCLCLVLFAYLTFPYERLRDRIVAEFNAHQTGPKPLRLKLGDLSSYWLSGIEAEQIELISPAEPASAEPGASGEAAKPQKPKVMTIDQAHGSISLLRLLFGTVHISFGADAFGGELSGLTSDADGSRKLEIELDELDFGQAPLFGDAVGLPLSGKLSGTIDLLLPEGKLSKADGKINLKVVALAVGDGKAKIRDAIALPKVDAGDLVLEAEATNGQLKVTNLGAKGPDLELSSDGSLRLKDNFDSSIMSLGLRFKFTDSYTNKNEITRGLFGSGTTPGLFDLDPKNKRAKRPDGFYGWRASGSVAHLQFTPSQNAGGGETPEAGTGVAAGTSKRKRRPAAASAE